MKRFKVGRDIVYPEQGPATITDIATQAINGIEIELYILKPYHNSGNATIAVPVAKHGLRSLVTPAQARAALKKLTGVRKKSRSRWHIQARDLRADINSGDITKLCEVVRNLYTEDGQGLSYGARQLYDEALQRLVTELALVFDLAPSELEPLIEETIETRKVQKELI